MATKADSALTTELVDAMVQLSFAVHDALARLAAAHDLSVTQLRLLGILRDRTPPMTAIAEHLGLDRSSVTGLIDRAERRGLVTRIPSTDDARVTLVRATPSGLDLVRRLAALVSTEIDTLLGPLGRVEREGLVRVAASILGPALNDRITRHGP
jgi:DNA-binding MarR family transcriptional regulator